MGKYIIKSKPYEEGIEAESVEDAMCKFAFKMDLDMNVYFEALPIPDVKRP